MSKYSVALAGVLGGRGGIQTHVFWLSRALLETGHRVLLLSMGPTLQPKDWQSVEELSRYGMFEVESVYDGPSGRRSVVSAASRICSVLRHFRPDIYLACGTGWNLFGPAILSGRCRRRVFHEVMSGVAENWRDSRWVVRNGFHEVIAQAAPVARNFERTFRWRKPVLVLPAFPEPLELSAHLPEVRHRVVPLGNARAAFFGRLVPHKQALWLVRQWPRLSSYLAELHVFGTGPEERPIHDLIAFERWQDRVFCHGAYPDGQAYADLLSSFDLTLLPTIGAEGAPLVLLESLACGVPFAAFDAGGIPDYANPDCTIVPRAKVESFVPAVRQMAKRLAQGAIQQPVIRQFYMDHFAYSRLKRRWLTFLGDGEAK